MFKWSVISPKQIIEKAQKLNQIRTKPFLSHQSSHDPSDSSDFPVHETVFFSFFFSFFHDLLWHVFCVHLCEPLRCLADLCQWFSVGGPDNSSLPPDGFCLRCWPPAFPPEGLPLFLHYDFISRIKKCVVKCVVSVWVYEHNWCAMAVI